MTSALIDPAQLKTLLATQAGVKIVDASYSLPPSSLGIPGAVDFDIDEVADLAAPFAHTVPDAETFAQAVSALGIGNDDLVIVYDRAGISFAAARAWWMFRLFGHDKVKVLNGGLPAWLRAGGAVAEKNASPAPATFKAQPRPELLKLADQMVANIGRGDFLVLDARDSKRFTDGHIPRSLSVPYAGLLTADGALKDRAELEKIFQANAAGRKIACTCGSGVTACVLALALYELGRFDAAVYDGSWTEWGSGPHPKESGAAAS